VILLHPRDEHVAAFLRGDRPRRRVAVGAPILMTAEAPATTPAPVDVRRHFTVAPRLEALAVYKGELVCTNEDLIRNAAPTWSPMTPADIERQTGMVERRYSELSLDEMALLAARAALAKADRTPGDIGAVVVCTCTGARTMPSTATWLSARLGAVGSHASFDLVAAGAGLPYGLAEAARLLQEVKRPVLLVTVEKFSDRVGRVRPSRMLFGDGAAALVVGVTDGRPDIEVFQTYASGPVSQIESITVDGPDARALVKRYLDQMFDELRLLPDPDGGGRRMLDAIDLIVPHQADQATVTALAREIGFAADRLYFNVSHVGNTSSASIPIAIHDAVATGVIDRPRLVFAPGFGAGAVAGYVCLRVDPGVVAVDGADGLVPAALSVH
jgi:3-oxoacyl-[acyl-carrier-protein] synthase III